MRESKCHVGFTSYKEQQDIVLSPLSILTIQYSPTNILKTLFGNSYRCCGKWTSTTITSFIALVSCLSTYMYTWQVDIGHSCWAYKCLKTTRRGNNNGLGHIGCEQSGESQARSSYVLMSINSKHKRYRFTENLLHLRTCKLYRLGPYLPTKCVLWWMLWNYFHPYC